MQWLEIWKSAIANPFPTAVAIVATLVSIVALTFVFRRGVSPSSDTIESQNLSVDDRTQEVVRLILKKDFVKDIVVEQLRLTANKPRFSFKEFCVYGMPAFLALALIVVLVGMVYANPDYLQHPDRLPTFVTQAFSIIIGYYFGAAATKT